eukprot:3133243-Ditylum_brightwellii.AAC.1
MLQTRLLTIPTKAQNKTQKQQTTVVVGNCQTFPIMRKDAEKRACTNCTQKMDSQVAVLCFHWQYFSGMLTKDF